MQNLSEDDLNIAGMSDEELAQAWTLWFRLAQYTNDYDSPYTHGAFTEITWADLAGEEESLESERTARLLDDERDGLTLTQPIP